MSYVLKLEDAFIHPSTYPRETYHLFGKDPMLAACESILFAATKETDLIPAQTVRKMTEEEKDKEADRIFISAAENVSHQRRKTGKRYKSTFKEPLVQRLMEEADEKGKVLPRSRQQFEAVKDTSRHNSRTRKAKGKPRRDCGDTYYNRQYHRIKETESFRDAVSDDWDITRDQAKANADTVEKARETYSKLLDDAKKKMDRLTKELDAIDKEWKALVERSRKTSLEFAETNCMIDSYEKICEDLKLL